MSDEDRWPRDTLGNRIYQHNVDLANERAAELREEAAILVQMLCEYTGCSAEAIRATVRSRAKESREKWKNIRQ